MYGQSRVFYGMARDGFLPPAFARVHPTFRTPHLCTIIVGIVGAAIAAIFPLDILADLVSIGTLMAFISVCVGIMILRITCPKRPRKFRTPYVWFVAPAGIFVCGVMMFSLSDRHLGAAGRVDRLGFPHLLRLQHPACSAMEMDRL